MDSGDSQIPSGSKQNPPVVEGENIAVQLVENAGQNNIDNDGGTVVAAASSLTRTGSGDGTSVMSLGGSPSTVNLPLGNMPVHRMDTRRPKVMPDHYDGKIAWTDFHAHFEVCARVNGWSNEQKADYMAVSLRGAAQQVYSDLPSQSKGDFQAIVRALEGRFHPAHQAELFRAQLRSRVRGPKESLPELGQSIRRLIARSYPAAPLDLTETLAKDHFLDALEDSDMRLKLRQNKPQTLDEAVCQAVELDAFNTAEKHRRAGIGKAVRMVQSGDAENGAEQNINSVTVKAVQSDLEKKVNQIAEQLQGLVTNSRPSYQSKRTDRRPYYSGPFTGSCYQCGKVGHKKQECPEVPTTGGNSRNEPKVSASRNAPKPQGN